MASGGCDQVFAALVDCVAAAVKDDGSGTTQPLPCLDAADSVRKCMEENAGKYAHTLDLIGAGGEGEADANKANCGLVLEVMKVQEAYVEVQDTVAKIELRARESKACKDAFEALKECAADLAAGGVTTTLPLPCLEFAASFKKCEDISSSNFERGSLPR